MVSKKNEVLKEFEPALGFAGASIGSSVLGGAFQSKLPAGVSNPLITTGSTIGTFVGPVVALGAFSFVTKKLKKVEKKIKRRQKITWQN